MNMNMNLIDTHCHLADRRLRCDIDQVISTAAAAGVNMMISAASDIPDARIAADIASAHREVFCTAGVHPHHASEQGESYLADIEQLAAHERNVAIGEIGLDYHYDYSPRPRQQEVFAEQLALAARLGKVIVIHTREAFDDTMAIVRDSGVDGRAMVFHSFTGGAAEVRRILDIGAMVSFSGIATFKTADDIRAGVLIVPDDRILVETDAPYLSPEPVRNVRVNQPAHVAHVAVRLASLRGTAPEQFAEQTTANARRFFGL
ncbi:MAG: TatD family hydrolase [Phycisphaerae bacterium]|jgi:TatD DNase family protein|nr:TatD family hydrolase [Phycisphaerae bacterium]